MVIQNISLLLLYSVVKVLTFPVCIMMSFIWLHCLERSFSPNSAIVYLWCKIIAIDHVHAKASSKNPGKIAAASSFTTVHRKKWGQKYRAFYYKDLPWVAQLPIEQICYVLLPTVHNKERVSYCHILHQEWALLVEKPSCSAVKGTRWMN